MKKDSKKLQQPTIFCQTSSLKRCMTVHGTPVRHKRWNRKRIAQILESKILTTIIGPIRAQHTLIIGVQGVLAAIMGNRVIRTGKRPRRMMESIITFTKTLVMTIRVMEVPVMIVGAMSIRLAHNNKRLKVTKDPTTSTHNKIMSRKVVSLFFLLTPS